MFPSMSRLSSSALAISAYDEMLKIKNKKKFRQEHSSEIALYEAVVRFLKEHSPDGKMDTLKILQESLHNVSNYWLDKAGHLWYPFSRWRICHFSPREK